MAPNVAVVYCAVLEDEVEALAAGLENVVCLHKLRQGLHNDPPLLRREVQEAVSIIEETRPEVEVIALGYGLCSRGTEGVRTARCRLVLARAHDCITLLLGDRRRYGEYVRRFPGTYWYSPGWNRHHIPPGRLRFDTLRSQYAEKYGEEDADYLMEEEQRWFTTYDRATFVDLGVIPTDGHEQFTQECAQWLGWNYDRQCGDPNLMRALLAGEWDERFLVLEPGQTLTMTADDEVIRAA